MASMVSADGVVWTTPQALGMLVPLTTSPKAMCDARATTQKHGASPGNIRKGCVSSQLAAGNTRRSRVLRASFASARMKRGQNARTPKSESIDSDRRSGARKRQPPRHVRLRPFPTSDCALCALTPNTQRRVHAPPPNARPPRACSPRARFGHHHPTNPRPPLLIPLRRQPETWQLQLTVLALLVADVHRPRVPLRATATPPLLPLRWQPKVCPLR